MLLLWRPRHRFQYAEFIALDDAVTAHYVGELSKRKLRAITKALEEPKPIIPSERLPKQLEALTAKEERMKGALTDLEQLKEIAKPLEYISMQIRLIRNADNLRREREFYEQALRQKKLEDIIAYGSMVQQDEELLALLD